jgi:enoyl-CoA hydratase/carnithine racemase
MAEDRSSAPDDDLVVVDRRDDDVVVVRLNRPKMNALSTAMLARVEATMTALAVDPPGAVVIWGGERIFAAGADVGEFQEPGAPARVAEGFGGATLAIAGCPCVTIAAITGYALGGGLELALACDLRVLSEDAKLGQPEILLGIIPGGGATQRLPRLVGPARAKDIVLTGRQVGADEALRIGLADRVVPAGSVLDEARWHLYM